MNKHHGGAEWIKASFKVNMSPLGVTVADLLGDLFGGIYHLETKDLKAVDWASDHHIAFTLRYKSLSTFDYDELTRLVFLCHDYALRCSISARANNMLELMFHRREREGGISKRHPTIESALELWRKYHQFERIEPGEVER